MKKLVFPFLATLMLLAGAGSALVGCKDPTTAFNQQALELQKKYRAIDDSIIQSYLARNKYGPGSYTRTNTGLYLITLKENPLGTLASTGKQVAVQYEGRLITQGRENVIFDSSYNGRTLCNCYQFTVGATNPSNGAPLNITGWTQGVETMREGEHKLLLVPSYLAYGATGSGNTIGPNTPLLFDMMVVAVSPK